MIVNHYRDLKVGALSLPSSYRSHELRSDAFENIAHFAHSLYLIYSTPYIRFGGHTIVFYRYPRALVILSAAGWEQATAIIRWNPSLGKTEQLHGKVGKHSFNITYFYELY